MPARYIVGTEGVIAYAEINPDTPSVQTRVSCYLFCAALRIQRVYGTMTLPG